ncbi:pre-mRNA 3' end processing protein WDR33-like [Liolophura sinensis]|uniref:pre-mRNA 3' end processing protein WDR33-like n=1 Tax=Liolophura sinensis TaxID=3198878 RepID=UPI003158C27F
MMQAVQMMNMMRGPPPGPRGPPPRGPMVAGPRGSPGQMGQGPRSYYNPRMPLQQQNRAPGNYGYRQRMEASQNLMFDGKRMRKAVHRKTVDYNSSVIKYLENRVWQRDFRDARQIQPDRLYTLELVPPSCMLSNPMNAVTTKFVRTSTNKFRCPIFVLTWTPEGRRLVTGASSGEFTLWNGLTFNFETILQAHDTSVRAMQWSHNDMWMVTADHAGFIKYWQTNMNNVKMYQGHKEAVRGISFCPTDSKFSTCSDDGTVRVWDFMRCHEERILRGHGSDVKCVDWHPLKGIIASGSKDSQQPVKLWDPKSGNSLATIHGHKSTVMSLKWNRNGNWLLTASRDHLLKLFDIRNMKEEMQTFKGHKKEATAAAWHPIHESLFASGGSDGAIMFWLVGTDKEVGGMEEAHEGMVWTLAWHPLGHILASGSNDHSTKFWTRNRPGDMMRDKYNLNTLPAGTEQELLEYDLEPQNVPAIPGMGLEHGLPEHLKPKEEAEDNLPSIPGLNWSEDETFYKQQELANMPKKKIPFSRPVPRSFEMAWKENRLPPKMANPPPKEDHRPGRNQPPPPHPNHGNPNNHGNPQNRGAPPHGLEGMMGPGPGPGPRPGMFKGPNPQFQGPGPEGGQRPGPPGGLPQQMSQDHDERRGDQRMGPGGQGQMDPRGHGQMGLGGQGQMGPGGQSQMGPGGQGQMGPGGRGLIGPGGPMDRGGLSQMGPGGPRGPPHHSGGPPPMHQQPGPGGPGQMRGPNMAPGQRGSEDEDLRRRDQDFRQPPNQDRWQQNPQDTFGGGNHFSTVPQDKDFRSRPESDFHRGDEDMRFGGQAGRQSSGRGGRDGWNEEYRDFDERRGRGQGGDVPGRGGGGMGARQDTDYRFSQQTAGFDPSAENWDGDQGRGLPKNMRGFHQEGGFDAFSSGDRDERSNREQSPHQRGPSQYSQPDGMRKRTYEEGPGRGRGNSTSNLSRGGSGSYRGHHGSGQHSDHIDSHGPKYGRHDSPTEFGDQYSGHSQRPSYGQSRGRGRGSRGRGDYRSPRYRGGSGRGAQRGQ